MNCLSGNVRRALKTPGPDELCWALANRVENDRGLESLTEALDALAIVAVTDIKGTIVYTNDEFSRISGYSKAELILPH